LKKYDPTPIIMVAGLAAGHWGGDAGPISAALDRGAISAGE